jgi:hypothetical protein
VETLRAKAWQVQGSDAARAAQGGALGTITENDMHKFAKWHHQNNMKYLNVTRHVVGQCLMSGRLTKK